MISKYLTEIPGFAGQGSGLQYYLSKNGNANFKVGTEN
jgi:hypothetical protein